MRQRAFLQVDVFTDTPYRGNPVAVVLDAAGLDDARMQAIARWTNLSETTFVLPADDASADYRLRIFTPGSELPFAGHPSVGSAHAVLQSGRATARNAALVQQCGAGLVPLSIDAETRRIWLRLPEAGLTRLSESQHLAVEQALGLRCAPGAAAIDVGPVWITARAASGGEVLAARPDLAAVERLSREYEVIGITVFGGYEGQAEQFEVRSFAPASGVPEDPVCGSGNGCVAAWLAHLGQREAYVARQGRAIGRDGRVFVRYADTGIEIGGTAVTCVRGEILA